MSLEYVPQRRGNYGSNDKCGGDGTLTFPLYGWPRVVKQIVIFRIDGEFDSQRVGIKYC